VVRKKRKQLAGNSNPPASGLNKTHIISQPLQQILYRAKTTPPIILDIRKRKPGIQWT
jgi:hypothetical protein